MEPNIIKALCFLIFALIGTAILLAILQDKINQRTALLNMSDFSGRGILILAMGIMAGAVGLEKAIAEFFRAVIIDFRLRYRFVSRISGIDHKPSILVRLADIICFILVVIACGIMAVTVGFHLAVQKFMEVSNRCFLTLVGQLNVPMKSLIQN